MYLMPAASGYLLFPYVALWCWVQEGFTHWSQRCMCIPASLLTCVCPEVTPVI